MHPGMMHWWRTRHHASRESGVHAGCGSRAGFVQWETAPHHDDVGAGAFGVRRPLRYLAYKLELDEAQVAELARVLNELKTERAQGDVDGRRATAGLADAIAGDVFDAAKATDNATLRVRSAERLRDVLVQALGRIHALLRPEQRTRLAYLIRTGSLSI